MDESLKRHFLALLPPPEVREALAAQRIPDGARPVDPRDLHVTVAFLGTLAAESTSLALRAAREAARGPVTVRLDTLQTWSGPRILCATGDADDGLRGLIGRLAVALGSAGLLSSGRPYVPHATLARKVPQAVGETSHLLAAPVAWESRSLSLMASRDGVQPRYFRIDELPLTPV